MRRLILGYWDRGRRVPGLIEQMSETLKRMQAMEARADKQDQVIADLLKQNAGMLSSIQQIATHQSEDRKAVATQGDSIKQLLEENKRLLAQLGAIEEWRDQHDETRRQWNAEVRRVAWSVARPMLGMLGLLVTVALMNFLAHLDFGALMHAASSIRF